MGKDVKHRDFTYWLEFGMTMVLALYIGFMGYVWWAL